MRVADLVFSGVPGYIDQDLLNKTYQELYGGFNQTFVARNGSVPNHTIQEAVRYNLITFSGAKTAQQVEDLRSAVFSGEANTLLPYTEFVKKALAIDAKYNLNYLKAEYDAVRRAGAMAQKWQRIQRDARVYPLLRYRTVGDSAVRPEHVALEGITRPVNDSFWSTFYPPNGWNCRCTVEQLREGEITSDELVEERSADSKVAPEFRSNVGQTGTVFEKTHPYYQGLKTASKAKRMAIKRAIANQYDGQDGYSLEHFDQETGGFFARHKTHNEKNEIEENKKIGIMLANKGEAVILKEISKEQNVKNPDALVNGLVTDFKACRPTTTSIHNAISRAKKQGATGVVINITEPVSASEVERFVKGKLNWYPAGTFQEIWYIVNGIIYKYPV